MDGNVSAPLCRYVAPIERLALRRYVDDLGSIAEALYLPPIDT